MAVDVAVMVATLVSLVQAVQKRSRQLSGLVQNQTHVRIQIWQCHKIVRCD